MTTMYVCHFWDAATGPFANIVPFEVDRFDDAHVWMTDKNGEDVRWPRWGQSKWFDSFEGAQMYHVVQLPHEWGILNKKLLELRAREDAIKALTIDDLPSLRNLAEHQHADT